MAVSHSDISVFIASDHAGFVLKNFLIGFLKVEGYSVEDMGAHSFSGEDDYPDFITPCARKVAEMNVGGGISYDEVISTRISTSGEAASTSTSGDFVATGANKNPCESYAFARVFGIVIGGSGQGEAMVANRVSGARAAVFYGGANALGSIDEKGTMPADNLAIIRLARLHNDANILSLGARFVSEELAQTVALLFLETKFSEEERHVRRIQKF